MSRRCQTAYLSSITKELQGELRLDVVANVEDMRLYIEGRISPEPRLIRFVTNRPPLRHEIVTKVLEKAQGMCVLPN